MLERKSLHNGFEYLEIQNSHIQAKIALQGAHLFEYKVDGRDLLWLSETSPFEKGVAIRGGVPICWPAFGMQNPSLSQHGFARTQLWELLSFTELTEDCSELILQLQHNEETLALWAYKFDLRLVLTLGKELKIQLITTNCDTKSFELSEALHSYFPISDIGDVKIHGLGTKPYWDALSDTVDFEKEVIVFDGEFDRVYQEVDSPLLLETNKIKIQITNQGSSSVVVWNPWVEKADRMSGMERESYREFVCIESANAREDTRTLSAGETHTLEAKISFIS
ncbi:MAG: D-hexose-6-phosphate mutarotase [Helicobacteraceae bacterium]|nr:D-hexose-6-phosphate mutarotase [Helicobacteraceae bacterium]